MAKKKEWKMIAGRGAPGSTNWGYDGNIPLSQYEDWHKVLQEHVGETVALTGGGGPGTYGYGKLTGSEIIPFGPHGEMGLSAHIEKLYDPDKTWREPENFDPWVNSWQIWIGGIAPKFKYRPFKMTAVKAAKPKKASKPKSRSRRSNTALGGVR